MAFSKAKILRFNDITTCAPPPGAYNPKFDNHVMGAVVYTKDNKPIPPESPTTSVSDTKSVHSCASGRTFRTPTVPRRKRTSLPNSSNQKTTNLKAKLFSPIKSEALREKIVECANKDETIKDLENQIEELKFAISALKVDKSELTRERDELIIKLKDVEEKLENLRLLLDNSKMEKQSISDDFEKLKAELKAQNSEQMKQLQDNLNLLQERLKINLEETENIIKETEEKLADKEIKCCNLSTELSQLRDEYEELKKKYEESLNTCDDIQKSHETEIKSLRRLHESEIDELERNITDVVKQWQETVKQIEADHVNKITEIKDKHDSDLTELKECFSSEKQELEKKSEEYKTELSQLVIELEDARKKISVEIELRELDMKKSSEEQHRYEITLNKTYETVDALKNRLLNSDRDVEQLNKEIEQLESSKLQIESKYSEVNEKLQEVIEERDALKADNETLLQIHGKVVTLKEEFLKKIDVLKTTADLEIERLNTELTNAKTELHSYVRDQQKMNTNTESLISNFRTEYECLENEVVKHVQKINSLEDTLEIKNTTINAQEEIISEQNSQIQELKNKLKEREHELNEIASVYKKFIDRSKEYDDLQQKHEELLQKCSALEKTVAEQNSLIGPFREQLENYERECQLLLVHKFEAEKEAKEIGLKYAQILGHQNNKQKIKHIVDLKKKNYELMENKNECEAKLLQQKRIIDKLKQKVAQLTKLPKSIPSQELDKENISSPLRKHNSSLKERN